MKIERIFWIIAVSTLAILALNFKSKKNTVTEYLPGDTTFVNVNIPIPEPYDTIIYDTDTINLPGRTDTIIIVDTHYVYNDYFKMYSYKIDTTINEVDIISDIKITQNRLYNYGIRTQNNRKTVILKPEMNNFGIGIIAGVDLISPVFSYEFNHSQIGIGYNLYNSSPILMYQYKFSFKRHE